MKPKRSSNNLFGAADSLSGAQLPTFLDVGKAWRQCRLDMESENPGTNILNRQVAWKVRKDTRQKKIADNFACFLHGLTWNISTVDFLFSEIQGTKEK